MGVKDRKQKVCDLLKSIETGDPEPIAVISVNRYIQHNLKVEDGLAGFAPLFRLSKGFAKVNTLRVFQDGDFVFAHTSYDFSGFLPTMIGFDVFRFEAELIVEHWDNLQEKAAYPNPSGRWMMDGPREVLDVAQTQENKALARAFVETILIHRRMDRLSVYGDGDRYIQHNPRMGDGFWALRTAWRASPEQGMATKYERIHRVLGEGNFALVMSEGTLNERPAAFYDLFRIDQGKIAEHWDVVEITPPSEKWKNGNGKF